MPSPFDCLGPELRAPAVCAALECLAGGSEVERGAVFTWPEMAAAILDLCGYTVIARCIGRGCWSHRSVTATSC